MKIIKLTGSIIFLFLFGCTSSRITHSWKSKNVVAKKYDNILVMDLNNETDISIVEKMENHMVGDLTDLGYSSTSSLKEYGPETFRKIYDGSAITQLQNSRFDVVITIVLLTKTQEKVYIPGGFLGYFNSIYDRIYTPGYYSTSTRYFWESNLYDIATRELLYSARTESFDPASTERLGHEYGKMIVKDMVKKKVLNRRVKVSTEQKIVSIK